MRSGYLRSKVGGAILGVTMLLGLLGVGAMTSLTAQAQWQQWPQGRDRDRDYRRDDRYGRGYYGYQIARDRGYQDGLSTGQADSRNGQNFNPERSHYYKNASYGYDRSFGNKDAYKQAYRDAFVRGYEDGYRRYRGNRGNNGRWRNPIWFPW